MKLYDALTPNTLRVRVFLAELGIDLPRVPVDITAGGTRTAEFLAINTLGELPVLQVDDGRILTESVAICRYVQTLHPEPALFGRDAYGQAVVEMWQRRIELHFFDSLGAYARHSFPFFADKIEQLPAFADSQMRRFDKVCAWLDRELADGRPFFAGDDFSVADITGMATLFGCDIAGKSIADDLRHLKRWEQAMRSRPSFQGQFAQAA